MSELTLDQLGPADFPSVRSDALALETRARDRAGHARLGEAVWRDLDGPGPDSAVFSARAEGGLVGLVHVARSDNFAPQHWVIGSVADPAVQTDRVPELLGAAIAHIASRGGGRAVLWRFGANDADDAVLEKLGFLAERALHEMRVALPLSETPRWPPGVSVRTFVPGADDDAWLAVNNLAFENHPDQGGWIRDTLHRRMAEPWFDPSLFLLAFDGAGLAGFNWLKVHEGHGRDPRLGEIFVIGVHPRTQGTGLGRALAVSGLALVADRGIETGDLFVAAENTAAVGLYTALGFTVHRTDRAYTREIAADV